MSVESEGPSNVVPFLRTASCSLVQLMMGRFFCPSLQGLQGLNKIIEISLNT